MMAMGPQYPHLPAGIWRPDMRKFPVTLLYILSLSLVDSVDRFWARYGLPRSFHFGTNKLQGGSNFEMEESVEGLGFR